MERNEERDFSEGLETVVQGMKIAALGAEEREQSIAVILEKGMRRRLFLRSVMAQVGRLGFGNLFFGVGDCLFLALLATLLSWGFLYEEFLKREIFLGVILFFWSPFFYMLAHGLTVWKELSVGTYEQLMACRISIKEVTVIRMLIFGGCSAFFSVAASLLMKLWQGVEQPVAWMLSLSFLGLFLYAWMELWVTWKWRGAMVRLAVPVFWIGLGIVELLVQEYLLLPRIPQDFLWLGAAVAAGGYFGTVRRFYFCV